MVLHNAETNGYPWRECIRNALTFCDKVYILEVDSSEEDINAIYEEFGNESDNRIVLQHGKGEWDMDDIAIVGKMKQKAREMVQEDYCVYLDSDEILVVKDKSALMDLVLHNSHADVFAVPYVTFFGNPYQIANFADAENFWRWKIFRNKSHIGHGVHGTARQYDEDGKMYMDKKVSDGCEIINLQTLEIMPSVMFMPQHYMEAGNMYRQVPQKLEEKSIVTTMFSETINDFPIICMHYGWINFEEKAKNAIKYWTKTKAFKTGVEHSQLFDDLDEDKVAEKIAQWEEIDTIPLHIKSHPDIIKPRIAKQLKPKVLTLSLSNSGPFGVPKWNHMLAQALEQYDVQHFSFNEYVANAPTEATEIEKSVSFTNWVQGRGYDQDALVIFADGFWAATYQGPARVVSVIHGLWSHPLRDKWDDGLVEERKKLFEYQLAYYKKAKDIGHTLICVSPFIHKILKEEHGIDSILVPNSADLSFWDEVHIASMDKDRPLILHGITSNNKGADILKQIENHPKIKDTFDIGTIDEIAAAGQTSKPFAFKAADVAFLPTKWEASSYLLLECLANNLPIAAYRAGILNCLDLQRLDNIGVVVDKYDVDTFVDAIIEAYENSHKFKMGRIFLQENGMTFDVWADRLRKLIYEVM